MKISDVYPKFVIKDEWGRELEIRARNSLYTRTQLTGLVPGIEPGEEKPISRTQFAMLLLMKIEELFGEEELKRALGEEPPQTRNHTALDEWFGDHQEDKK